MKDSFIFYRSFYEAVKELDSQTQAAVMSAMCEYALDGTEPECSGVVLAMFRLMKPQIDANSKRFENGKKGGRPKTEHAEEETKPEPNRNQTITKANQTITKTEPNHNQTEPNPEKSKPNVSVNVNENVNVNEKEKGQREKRQSPFRPPTRDEVETYCKERGNHVDVDRFIDFYTAKGWMIGKNLMKDWKAAVRTWERDVGKTDARKPNNFQYEGRQRSPDEYRDLEAQLLGQTSQYAGGGTA